jgi:phospholipid N-methyltransferase
MPDQRTRHGPRREEIVLFAKNFVRHPKMLGSVIPSSRFLVQRLLGEINLARARVLVEYGPGIGNITGEILKRMGPDATLLVVEMNASFVDYLRRRYTDPRLHVVHGSAADIQQMLQDHGLSAADYVISGIPLSTISSELRQSIIRSTHGSLSADGRFLVYQFSPKVLHDLRNTFSQVKRSFEPLNVLPAHIFNCVP